MLSRTFNKRTCIKVCHAEVSNSSQGKYALSFLVLNQCSGKAHITVDGEYIDGSLLMSQYEIMLKLWGHEFVSKTKAVLVMFVLAMAVATFLLHMLLEMSVYAHTILSLITPFRVV